MEPVLIRRSLAPVIECSKAEVSRGRESAGRDSVRRAGSAEGRGGMGAAAAASGTNSSGMVAAAAGAGVLLASAAGRLMLRLAPQARRAKSDTRALGRAEGRKEEGREDREVEAKEREESAALVGWHAFDEVLRTHRRLARRRRRVVCRLQLSCSTQTVQASESCSPPVLVPLTHFQIPSAALLSQSCQRRRPISRQTLDPDGPRPEEDGKLTSRGVTGERSSVRVLPSCSLAQGVVKALAGGGEGQDR